MRAGDTASKQQAASALTWIEPTHVDIAAVTQHEHQHLPSNVSPATINSAASLADAIARDNMDELKRLLDQGVSVETPISVGDCTVPVHLACELGHLDALKQLVSRGARVNRVASADGETPLAFACRYGHAATIAWLVEHGGAVVNDPVHSNHTPLARAVEWGDLSVVQYLLAHGAEASSSHDLRASAWFIAIEDGRLRVLECLAHSRALELVDSDQLRLCLLEHAVHRASLTMARVLLSTRTFTHAELTASLCTATMLGHVTLMELLVASGADVNGTDGFGLTPMLFAIHRSTPSGRDTTPNAPPSTAETLLRLGADLSIPVKGGSLPVIHSIASSGRLDLLQLVRRLRGDDAVTAFCMPSRHDAYTPLHVAAQSGHLSVVRYIVEALAGTELDLDAESRYDETPLMLAAQEGHTDVVRYLFALGAAVNPEDSGGRSTALFGAAENGHFDVVQCLCESGADVQWRRYDGVSALYIAAQEGHVAVVEYLAEACHADLAAMSFALTALDEAVLRGNVAVARVLLAHNAQSRHDLALRSDVLCEAVLSGSLAIVELLLARGADVNAPYELEIDSERLVLTPLLVAAGRGDFAMVQCLCSCGADVEATSNEDETALFLAAMWRKLDVVEFLVNDMGANVQAMTSYACLPVDAALFDEDDGTTACLRRFGARASARAVAVDSDDVSASSQVRARDAADGVFRRRKRALDGLLSGAYLR